MNMESGISITEACRTRSLEKEDFARTCNEDGSVKQEHRTTFSLKDDPTKTITIDNNILYISGGAAILLVITAIVLLGIYFSKKRKS